jgi:thiol:disulfide interchange protein DsbA
MPCRRTLLALGALSVLSRSYGQGAPKDGAQFTTLKSPKPTAEPGKVEVLEFFSYGCPHCFAFEPALEPWRSHLPADVAFRRMPVPFLANAPNFQRTYFALEALGQLDRAHRKVFDAVHLQHKSLATPAEIADVVAAAGVDRAKFLDAFNGFTMQANVARANAAAKDYDIESVPTLVVGGRYVTSPAQAGGTEQALATVDQLVQRLRKL